MKNISIKISQCNGLPTLGLVSRSTAGTLWDSQSAQLVFKRPTELAEYNMTVMLKPDGGEWLETTVGKENTLILTNAFTQQGTLSVCVYFSDGAEYRLGSDTIILSFRDAPQDGSVPAEYESDVRQLVQKAVVAAEPNEETDEYDFINITGDKAFSLPISSTGTTNYNALTNKPQIEGVTLQGNKALAEIGIEEISNEQIWNIFN